MGKHARIKRDVVRRGSVVDRDRRSFGSGSRPTKCRVAPASYAVAVLREVIHLRGERGRRHGGLDARVPKRYSRGPAPSGSRRHRHRSVRAALGRSTTCRAEVRCHCVRSTVTARVASGASFASDWASSRPERRRSRIRRHARHNVSLFTTGSGAAVGGGVAHPWITNTVTSHERRRAPYSGFGAATVCSWRWSIAAAARSGSRRTAHRIRHALVGDTVSYWPRGGSLQRIACTHIGGQARERGRPPATAALVMSVRIVSSTSIDWRPW